jgi:hypothetical protein
MRDIIDYFTEATYKVIEENKTYTNDLIGLSLNIEPLADSQKQPTI